VYALSSLSKMPRLCKDSGHLVFLGNRIGKNSFTQNYFQNVLFWGAFLSSALHVDRPPNVPTLTTSYANGVSSYSLQCLTVGQSLLASVERFPDREAVVFPQNDIRKTFAQFQHDVSVNPAYQLKELEYALRKVQCKAIVCPSQFKTQRYYGMLRQLCPEMDTASPGGLRSSRLPDLRTVVVTDSQHPGALLWNDLMQAASSQHYQELQDLQKKLSFDDPINIQFTSGTTGNPKGVALTHHNVVNNCNVCAFFDFFLHKPNVRVCLPVPLYHCFGSVGGGIMMGIHGITLIFPSSAYDGYTNLETLQKERCTFVYGTPTMYIDMLGQPDLAKFDLTSVEGAIMAGSPCPPEIGRKIIKVMGIKELVIAYGTTENSPVTFCGYPTDNMERKTETVGCICPHSEEGQIVPLGTKGELMIRGYCVMLEYWQDKAKTEEVITKEHWYKTGDIASMDKFGYCKIEGRIKDMLIRGGENIYPAEIEEFLHTHPKVHEAQVIGVKDERMGEEVCACIRLNHGQVCTAEEIRDYCRGQIAHFKIPRYVTFVESYPLTVSGKIQKNKLREQTEKQLGL
uniref:Medium-chain acyl-CoA ligase ACSF2, mitochondrial n=1 Tax=Electrophorus electricus TaxID=8005 RepID=A0A4W4F1R4_ELEEL